MWIFCSRTANNRIDKLHELADDDHETSFSDLLAIDGSFTVHHHANIITLLLEMYIIT